ncbi:MAG: CPBP family intramembrane metalloprotease [Vallitaleaceae bacterium]|nr:CPBP family intramembrane metalloprotease [Vallitaleaceae bacterium]
MKAVKRILDALVYFVIVLVTQKIVYYGYSYFIFKLTENNSSLVNFFKLSGTLTTEESALEIISRTQIIPILLGWICVIAIIGLAFGLAKQKPLESVSNKLGLVNGLMSIIIGLGLVLLSNGFLSALRGSILLEPYLGGQKAVTAGNFFLTIITIGLMIPLFEELVFRGLILNRLSEVGSVWFAVFFTALLFSSSHMDVIQGASVFLLGVIAGLAVLKTKSIKSAILIHCVFNITNLYLGQMDEVYDGGQLIVFVVLGLLLTYFGVEKLVNA